MIRITCPKCGSDVEVPDDSAGKTAACPHCGSVNVVPLPVQAPGAAPPPAPAPLSEKDARMWAMFCHLGGLAGTMFLCFGNIIAPLIIWLIQKDKSSFVDRHGKEALNFQISWTIYALVAVPLIFVFCIGVFILAALAVAGLILTILASINANQGGYYQYPLTIRFIR